MLTTSCFHILNNQSLKNVNHIGLAAAVEFIHAATLLHDDVVDNDVVVDDDDVDDDDVDNDVVVDDEKFSLLKSPYKIYLLIFLISIIIVFLIIILAFTPSSYNYVNTQPYYNQNKIY